MTDGTAPTQNSKDWISGATHKPGSASRRYLIVDDIEEMRMTLRRMIRHGDEGVDIDLAAGGQEALGHLRRAMQRHEPYDVVCLDLMMPDMPGQDLLRAILEEGLVDRRHTGLFVLSGHQDRDAIAAAKSNGALEVLQKPISAANLVERFRRWQVFRTRFAKS